MHAIDTARRAHLAATLTPCVHAMGMAAGAWVHLKTLAFDDVIGGGRQKPDYKGMGVVAGSRL